MPDGAAGVVDDVPDGAAGVVDDAPDGAAGVVAADPPARKVPQKRRRTKVLQTIHSEAKHPLISPSAQHDRTCKRQCGTFGKVRVNEIHTQFWEMNYDQRRAWIYSHVKTHPTKERDHGST